MKEYEKSHLEGARTCLENAWTVNASANHIMLNTGAYGVARSLFILAGEEAIKAHVTAEFAFFPKRDKNEIKEAYWNHKFKHERIRHVIGALHQAVADLRSVPNAYPEKEKLDEAFKQYDAQKYDVKDMVKWWTDANEEKNNGLYVSNIKYKEWTTPARYGLQDAAKARQHTGLLLEYVKYYLQDLRTLDGYLFMKAAAAENGG